MNITVAPHGFRVRLPMSAAVDMKVLKDRFGFNSYISEIYPDYASGRRNYMGRWDMSGMEFWVLSRLYWNPYANVSALRDEYITKTYGKAAPEMKKFYSLIRKSWYDDPSPSTLSDNPYSSAVHYIVEKGLEKKCRTALQKALKLAGKPNIKTNIKRTLDRFEDWMTHKQAFSSTKLTVPFVADAAKAKTPEAEQWSHAAKINGFRIMSRRKKSVKIRHRGQGHARQAKSLFPL